MRPQCLEPLLKVRREPARNEVNVLEEDGLACSGGLGNGLLGEPEALCAAHRHRQELVRAGEKRLNAERGIVARDACESDRRRGLRLAYDRLKVLLDLELDAEHISHEGTGRSFEPVGPESADEQERVASTSQSWRGRRAVRRSVSKLSYQGVSRNETYRPRRPRDQSAAAPRAQRRRGWRPSRSGARPCEPRQRRKSASAQTAGAARRSLH
jgi:hypothetical protein